MSTIQIDLQLLEAINLCDRKRLPLLLDPVPRCKLLRELYPTKADRDRLRTQLYRCLVAVRNYEAMRRADDRKFQVGVNASFREGVRKRLPWPTGEGGVR